MDHRASLSHPTPLDLASFVPYACNQLGAPFSVKILTRIQDEYISKIETASKKVKSSSKSATFQTQQQKIGGSAQSVDKSSVSVVKIGAVTQFDSNTIILTTVYDVLGRLVELMLIRPIAVPRLLMQVLTMTVPYQVHLTKFTIRCVDVKGEALFELGKMIPQCYLTEICLDDTPVAQRNYYMLIESVHVKLLSLDRCDIDDDDCEMIAAKLTHPMPAARSLLILSLVSNRITDRGAKFFGDALRSNRTLQCLNLAGNYITDDGAAHILNSLTEFHLSYDELVTKRKRLLEYVILRKTIYAKCYKELTLAAQERSPDENSSKRKTIFRGRKHSGVSTPGLDPISMKAETMTNELIGSYSDPFSLDETVSKNQYIYSKGNMTLCYLNLAYNNIGYATLAKLVQVVTYQSELVNKSATGIMRVVIEGNNVPVACEELGKLQELLEQIVASKSFKPLSVKRAKSKYR